MRWKTPSAMAERCHRCHKASLVELALSLLACAPLAVPFPTVASADDVHGCGELRVVDSGADSTLRFPLRHTDVRASVSGGIASVTVEQTFHNPYDRGIEAVYIFPLPHEAAVDDLEIRIGERRVRGQIHKRQEARKIYEAARERGQMAALLDQERPNIFTQQVANIQPGQEIVVRLHYVETLAYADGCYELVFPTVVGPRYIPGQQLGNNLVPVHAQGDDQGRGGQLESGTGWAPDTDRVPDASRITPPVVPPGMRTGHDIGIAVDVKTGVPIQDLASVNHVVDIERRERDVATVRLRPSDRLPNKDFVLQIRVAGLGPEFGLLSHRDPSAHDGFGFFTLQLQPEAEVTSSEARPKEMVFVLDCSGSMSGEPIAKSKAAMRWALQHLGPDDSFQIIRFSEHASPFAGTPVPNTPENVQRGLLYVDGLRGQGGTEMLSGIRAALDFPPDPERLRIVCFLTDGYIGNEEQIFAVVRERIGGARLFSFGIGNSVNRYLLDGLAQEGRGEVDYVALDAETRDTVERFYNRIAKPYLTDVSIDWGDLSVQDVEPARLPDVFAGQPLVLAGRYVEGGQGEIVVHGRLGRGPFQHRLRVELPERDIDRAEIGTLWARRRIDGLMRQMVHGESQDLVQQVTNTALEFRLVSRYTSYVAVDNQVVASDGKPMLVPQPVEMPQGVSYEGVFGVDAEATWVQCSEARSVAYQSAQPLHARGGLGSSMKVGLPAVGASRSMPPAPPPARSDKSVPVKSSSVGHVATRGESFSPSVGSDEQDMASNAGEPDRTGLEVQVALEQALVRIGEPIWIRIFVTNRGREVIELPKQLAASDGFLSIQVYAAGQLLPVPVVKKTPATTDRLELPPGARHTYVVELNALGAYHIATTGRYKIVIAAIGSKPLVKPAVCTFEAHE